MEWGGEGRVLVGGARVCFAVWEGCVGVVLPFGIGVTRVGLAVWEGCGCVVAGGVNFVKHAG